MPSMNTCWEKCGCSPSATCRIRREKCYWREILLSGMRLQLQPHERTFPTSVAIQPLAMRSFSSTCVRYVSSSLSSQTIVASKPTKTNQHQRSSAVDMPRDTHTFMAQHPVWTWRSGWRHAGERQKTLPASRGCWTTLKETLDAGTHSAANYCMTTPDLDGNIREFLDLL